MRICIISFVLFFSSLVSADVIVASAETINVHRMSDGQYEIVFWFKGLGVSFSLDQKTPIYINGERSGVKDLKILTLLVGKFPHIVTYDMVEIDQKEGPVKIRRAKEIMISSESYRTLREIKAH